MIFLGWFSCGATSAVACKLAVDRFGDAVKLVYIDTGAEHPDSERFRKDCEKWIGKEIQVIKSSKYENPLDVARKQRIFKIARISGAPCTLHLKKKVRQSFCEEFDTPIHIFGFEYSKHEVNRALRWKEQQSEHCYFPLIEAHLSKEDCLKIISAAGIEIPAMYKLGYLNNNCIGCFKAGMYYWNKIRVDFPDVFDETAKLERELGKTILKRSGKKLFLDELDPTWGRKKDLEIPDCGLFCNLELTGLRVLEIDDILPTITFDEEKYK